VYINCFEKSSFINKSYPATSTESFSLFLINIYCLFINDSLDSGTYVGAYSYYRFCRNTAIIPFCELSSI